MILLPTGYSRGPEIISQDPIKRQSFLWNMHGSDIPNPAELTLYLTKQKSNQVILAVKSFQGDPLFLAGHLRSRVIRPLPFSPGSSLLSNYISFSVWLHWVFITACGLSLVSVSRGYSSLRCSGFPLWWLLLLWSMGSRHTGFSSCGSQALVDRLYSCGTWAQFLQGMWYLPRLGINLEYPALTGRFLTTGPPGKSLTFFKILQQPVLSLTRQPQQWLSFFLKCSFSLGLQISEQAPFPPKIFC